MKKYGKILLLTLVGIQLFVGVSPAAELRIITTGTGYGMVLGEQLLCPDICRKEYEEGTVVHLKADPFPDSRFVGWLIDGEPHKGVLTIEKDTVVTAMFELIAGLDELTVYWYNGSVKEQATIATDEMYLFLEKREKWGVSTEEEYEAAIREIARRFHPGAEVLGEVDRTMTLKSPEPLTKDQWFQALSSLKELQYVRYGGPVLYDDPESRSGWRLPVDKISARFPLSYTEERIQVIEQEFGLVRLEAYALDPNDFYYYVGEPLQAIRVANRLYESGKAESASPEIIIRYNLLNMVPNDEYFRDGKQWHLNNTRPGFVGEDINVLDAWNLADSSGQKIRGTGVIISIVDDGMEIAHEDLLPNVLGAKSYDFFEEDSDPLDNEGIDVAEDIHKYPDPLPQICIEPGCHGTPVAGIAAAEGFNGIGVCGVAPDASLVGYRMLSSSGRYGLSMPKLIGVFNRNMQEIDVYNNSWLPSKLIEVDERRLKAIRKGVGAREYMGQGGRGGKGNIYVFAGGNFGNNDLNSNYHAFANSRYTIAVSGTGHTGKSITVPGANILVNAPTGSATTDLTGEKGFDQNIGVYINLQYLRDIFRAGVPREVFDALNTPDFLDKHYTKETLLAAIEQYIGAEKTATYKEIFLEQANFGPPDSANYFTEFAGSSGAAPVVSGVVALMLQANPELGWRDVQHILAETAEKNDPLDDDWTTNAAGYHINHKYGFGRVDATAAVQKALDWEPLTDRGLVEIEEINLGGIEGDFEGDDGVSSMIPMGKFEGNLRVEYAEVVLTALDHKQFTDLEVILTSPAGTTSVLAEPHDPPVNKRFFSWTLGSVRHFGEPSLGEWILTVKDLKKGNGYTGTRFLWTLRIYGTELPPPDPSYVKAVQVTSGGETLYHAGWEPLEDSDQLGFLYYSDPIDPTPGSEAQVVIHTSEAMQELSVALPGQAAVELTACAETQDGTCWQGPLPLPDLDEYPLTIRGQDTNGTFVLPFADVAPKTVSEWTASATDVGDTVHRLGPPNPPRLYTWRLVMPTPGLCYAAAGGITCSTTHENEDEAFRVSLRPRQESDDEPVEQFLMYAETNEEQTHHEGVYFTTQDMELLVHPGTTVMELCAGAPLTQACSDELPAPKEETVSQTWTVSTRLLGDDVCQVTVSHDDTSVLLELQPSSFCAAVEERPTTLQASALCPWNVRTAYEVVMISDGDAIKSFEGGWKFGSLYRYPFWELGEPWYASCTHEFRKMPQNTASGGDIWAWQWLCPALSDVPEWKTPPAPQVWEEDTQPYLPWDGDESDRQLLAKLVREEYDCTDWRDWTYAPQYGTSTWLFGEAPQERGSFASCLTHQTYSLYYPLAQCSYRMSPDEIVFPEDAGVIAVTLPFSGQTP